MSGHLSLAPTQWNKQLMFSKELLFSQELLFTLSIKGRSTHSSDELHTYV